MAAFFEKMSKLDSKLRQVFYSEIYNPENMEKYDMFLTVIKFAPREEKEVFYKSINENFVQHLENEANNNQKISEENYEKAYSEMESVLEVLENRLQVMMKHTEEVKPKIYEFRNMMKAGKEEAWKDIITDQMLDVPKPPAEKEVNENSVIVDLPKPSANVLQKKNLFDCIGERESRRKFTEEKLSLDELSYLLWATQGVRKKIEGRDVHMKTVPSGGARQPFETYIAVNYVEGLKSGIYRYLIFQHKLVFLHTMDNQIEKLIESSYNQDFVGNSAVVFFWAAIPYRMEWRYFLEAKKDILIEAGHICQNLYLAAESINCGTCAIAAYSQEKVDNMLKLDGKDEFVVYLAPVGKLQKTAE